MQPLGMRAQIVPLGVTEEAAVQLRGGDPWVEFTTSAVGLRTVTSFADWEDVPPPAAAPAEGDPALALVRIPGSRIERWLRPLVQYSEALMVVGGLSFGLTPKEMEAIFAALVDVGGFSLSDPNEDESTLMGNLRLVGQQASSDVRMLVSDDPLEIYWVQPPSNATTARHLR